VTKKQKYWLPICAKATLLVCEVNDIIPSDGEVIEGIASVDESAITGESAPVIRESGGDRSAVTGGTKSIERSHSYQDISDAAIPLWIV